MRIKIILYLIYYSLRQGVNPYLFFQIHTRYFNLEKWYFSKYEIEKDIPNKWKLESIYIEKKTTKEEILKNFNFPLFWKPEWWQNSHGITYIKDSTDLITFIQKTKDKKIQYLVQKSSIYLNEYEICFSKDPDNISEVIIHSIVQSVNVPWTFISWIHAKTQYIEVMVNYSQEEINQLKTYILEVGDFTLWRIGLKANSCEEMIDWKFQIFEINIFIPLPLKLLANNISIEEKEDFLRYWTLTLSQLTKIRKKTPYIEIFLRQIILHYKIKFSKNNSQ